MLKKISHKHLGKSDLGWLESHFHFSFAEYHNPEKMNYGVLRVVNDDKIKAGTGFPMHPHKDMEIISYAIDGELVHTDSMGHSRTLRRGEVQYMSAGTGVHHSEYVSEIGDGRFLQIWVIPREKGLNPQYGDYSFTWEERNNKWLHIVSDVTGGAPVKINQDINVYVMSLDKGCEAQFKVEAGRQAYMIQIEGESTVNRLDLEERDAIEAHEQRLDIFADEKSHFIIFEMKMEPIGRDSIGYKKAI